MDTHLGSVSGFIVCQDASLDFLFVIITRAILDANVVFYLRYIYKIIRLFYYFAKDILFTDFIDTMTGDTYKEQLDKTLETYSEDRNYFCIAASFKKNQ